MNLKSRGIGDKRPKYSSVETGFRSRLSSFVQPEGTGREGENNQQFARKSFRNCENAFGILSVLAKRLVEFEPQSFMFKNVNLSISLKQLASCSSLSCFGPILWNYVELLTCKDKSPELKDPFRTQVENINPMMAAHLILQLGWVEYKFSESQSFFNFVEKLDSKLLSKSIFVLYMEFTNPRNFVFCSQMGLLRLILDNILIILESKEGCRNSNWPQNREISDLIRIFILFLIADFFEAHLSPENEFQFDDCMVEVFVSLFNSCFSTGGSQIDAILGFKNAFLKETIVTCFEQLFGCKYRPNSPKDEDLPEQANFMECFYVIKQIRISLIEKLSSQLKPEIDGLLERDILAKQFIGECRRFAQKIVEYVPYFFVN